MDPRIRNGIFAGESGGDYNALFGFSNRNGGPFSHVRVSDMTLDQAIEFSDPNGPYAQWVKSQIGRVATPMGGYQVVGSTLRDMKNRMGLTGQERFTPALQDAIGSEIYKTQGIGAWEGYKGPSDTIQVSSKGGGPADPYAPENAIRGDNGMLSLDFLKGMAGGAINRSDPNMKWQQGYNPGMPPGPALGGIDPNSVVPVQGTQPQPEQDWLSRSVPDWLTPNRSDMLLAIGSGLLSGDDWASGGAQASENLLGVLSNQRARADEQAQIEQQRQDEWIQAQRDQEFAMDRINSTGQQQQQSSYNVPFNVVGRDQKTGEERVVAGYMENGTLMVDGPNGKVPASTVLTDTRIGGRNEQQDVVAGVGGIPNAVSVGQNGVPSFNFKRETEARNFGYAYEAIGAYKSAQNIFNTMTPDQVASISSNFQRWAAQNSTTKLSAGVINNIVNESGLQGAAAAAMSRYLQAVLRTDTGAAYTGTEFTSYGSTLLPTTSSNPEELRQKDMLIQNSLARMAANSGAAAPWLNGVLSGQYAYPGQVFEPSTNSGALDSSNVVSDEDVPEGIDPEDWKYVTPEQKKLWKQAN